MLTALVLICSTAITPDLRDCTRDNAASVILLPVQSTNSATCFMHGQAYLLKPRSVRSSETTTGSRSSALRSEVVDASVPQLSAKQ